MVASVLIRQPYLLSLGLSKSMLALVWIAGPLSGTLVQPYVGLKSDNCRMPWGKRRPFIVGGAIATITSLMVLAWAREIVGGVLGIFGADPESQGVKTCVMIFAVLFVYVLDFAINVSKCLRATHPSQEQRYLHFKSTSRYPRLYRRLCPYASTRGRQCMDNPFFRRRQHYGLPCREHQASEIFPVAGQ